MLYMVIRETRNKKIPMVVTFLHPQRDSTLHARVLGRGGKILRQELFVGVERIGSTLSYRADEYSLPA